MTGRSVTVSHSREFKVCKLSLWESRHLTSGRCDSCGTVAPLIGSAPPGTCGCRGAAKQAKMIWPYRYNTSASNNKETGKHHHQHGYHSHDKHSSQSKHKHQRRYHSSDQGAHSSKNKRRNSRSNRGSPKQEEEKRGQRRSHSSSNS